MAPVNIVYKVAQTRKELEDALSLVYKEYLRRGYIPKGYKSNIRLSVYNSLPSTTTFVAKQGKRVVAGVTLIPDSPLGLPMDKLYKRELDKLRKEGCRVSEVSQLAIDMSLFGASFFSMFNFNKLIFIFRLFKLVLDHTLDVDRLTDMCIVINPKHQFLYKFIFFEEMGPLKYYGLVNRAPALAFRLRLTGLAERAKNRKGVYRIFFGGKTDPKLFKGKVKLSPKDLKYLFVEKSDIFEKATKKQLEFIKRSYRNKAVDRIIDDSKRAPK